MKAKKLLVTILVGATLLGPTVASACFERAVPSQARKTVLELREDHRRLPALPATPVKTVRTPR